MTDIYTILGELKRKGTASALCMIVSTKGSTPLKSGAKMIVTGSGEIHGTIGGGNLEKKVIENAREVLKQGTSKFFEHNLLQEHGMCCGGTVNVYIEPVMPPNKLYIFGAGHVGRALAGYASTLDFEVYLIDEREEEMKQMKDSNVNKLPVQYKHMLPSLPFDQRTYIAIMTYEHEIDRDLLAHCLTKEFAYLGMIGSKRKVEVTKKMFTPLFDDELLNKVDMPMGYDINATGPEEIAISILTKILEVKNKKPQGDKKSQVTKRIQLL